jgi:hypothetical protein
MVGVVVLTWTPPNPAGAQPATQIAIDNDDIAGVVKTPSGGPEAGVSRQAQENPLDQSAGTLRPRRGTIQRSRRYGLAVSRAPFISVCCVGRFIPAIPHMQAC